MSFLVKVCCLLTIAVLFKLLGYEVPFAHHLESVPKTSSPMDQLFEEPEAEPSPAQMLPPENPVASEFSQIWPDIP